MELIISIGSLDKQQLSLHLSAPLTSRFVMSCDTSFSRGLICSASASVLFGFTPLYVQWLRPLNGNSLFAHRVLFSLLCALLILLFMNRWQPVIKALSKPVNVLGVFICSAIVGAQWWVFVWAPLNGYTLDVAMGYFLLPLTIALTSCIFLGERLTTLQKIAAAFAGCGVLHELLIQGELSWVVLMIAGTYPVYFLIKKKIDIDALTAFFLESLIVLLGILIIPGVSFNFDTVTDYPSLWLLLPGLGLLNAVSMLCYLSAARLLPMGLFGLLSYLEPALIFVVGFFSIGEAVSIEQWITNGLIWIAVLLVCTDSFKLMRVEQKRSQKAASTAA